MGQFGVSFSIKQCRSFEVSPVDCLDWLIGYAGFKRFRLMSYWNEIEMTAGKYNFSELDRQIKVITASGGTISLCLGVRQPRWPENHWPDWALELARKDREAALLRFIEATVNRYKVQPCVVSYQLENEALLEAFGEHPDVDRPRLRREFSLVKRLDSSRPIIMTTSTSWGIPLRSPIPDRVGFSYYQVVYDAAKQAYTTAFHRPWLHRLRAWLIRLLWRRSCFIHELQLEPWGPHNIWEMSMKEQMESMSPDQIRTNLKLASATRLSPIDLWGGEWWYWCYAVRHHPEIAETVLHTLSHRV